MSGRGAVEVEVALHRRDGLGWVVEVRVNDPAIDEIKTNEGQIDLDLSKLESLAADTDAYATYLTEAFFADEAVSTGLAEARRAAVHGRHELRVRLRVGRSAPDLHSVRWELLRDPDRPDASLVTQESVVFSRYLESRDYRNVEVRPGEALQALVAVAGPPEGSLKEYEIDGRTFAQVDVQGEIERATKALLGSEVTTLGEDEPVTLGGLIEALRAGPDILYLVCHGYIKTSGRDRGPRLLLQDADGKAEHLDGRELVTRLRELPVLPRLVVLASCMSASSTTDVGALAAVGPELAAIGVPAVLAMQDNVTMETVETMMPVFFSRLREQPEIDRALAIARGEVRDRPDWWVPVLFMRLKSGRVWYQPGFAGGVDHWSMLVDQIEVGNLTPVLGPGLNDPIIGSRRELARTWALDKKIPIPSPRDEDLPQVAQYIAKLWDDSYLRLSLRKAIGSRLLDNFRPELAEALGDEALARLEERVTKAKGAADEEALLELVRTVGRIRRDSDPYEPYKVLASLALPLYVTTEPSGLLADAVDGLERKPVSEYFRWTDRDGVWDRMPLEKPAATRGTEEEPLLFSLFGDLRIPGSVVLSEDDYFEFLTTFSDSSTRRELISSQVVEAFVHKPLLLVGFRIDDWDFRVLFRAIRSLQGSRAAHSSGVAVQLDPEASSQADAERVKGYFQQYFQQDFNIYWGSSATFLRELAVRREARQ